MNIEAVREDEGLAGLQIWLDVPPIEVGLKFIGDEDLNDIGLLCDFGCRNGFESILDGRLVIDAARALADEDVHAAIAQIERLRVSLTPVTDDSEDFALQRAQISVVIKIHLLCHRIPNSSRKASFQNSNPKRIEMRGGRVKFFMVFEIFKCSCAK